jgi:tRNA A-37 threonylcarbamoyl transferase component Bud32
MAESALSVGQMISGTYRVVRRVGAGGMGEIYEATHARLAGRYAIKLLRPEVAAASDALARFEREARVTSALQHPNIVQVVDFSVIEGGGAPYLVMEFLDGPELAQLMKRGGPLPVPRIVSYVKQIASGLMAAHEKDVVHRDLKPQNIFVLKPVGQDDELVKIVDFGISKVADVTTTITSMSTVMGTAHYMSPEQARGRVDEIDARSDQFSLAVIVYEMLTGHDAFTGDNVSSLVYQIVHEEPRALLEPGSPIPAPLVPVLRRALSKDKARRFPTVRAFATAFEEAAAAPAGATLDTIASRRSLLDARVDAPRRRRGVWLGAGVVVLGVVLVVVAWPMSHKPAASAVVVAPPASTAAPPRAPVAVAAPAPPKAEVAKVEAAPPPAPAEPAKPEGAPRNVARPARRLRSGAVKARASAAAPAVNCDPNYTLDAQGDKHFKPECFLNPSPAR